VLSIVDFHQIYGLRPLEYFKTSTTSKLHFQSLKEMSNVMLILCKY
jgi:hypothetical protein